MTSPDSGDNELVIPPSFRGHVTSLLGKNRAELVLGMAEWMVVREPQDLKPVVGDGTLWQYIFWVPSHSGEPTPRVIEVELRDVRLMRCVPTRIFRVA